MLRKNIPVPVPMPQPFYPRTCHQAWGDASTEAGGFHIELHPSMAARRPLTLSLKLPLHPVDSDDDEYEWDSTDIAELEALFQIALLLTLLHELGDFDTPHRITLWCDNTNVVRAFYKGRSRNPTLNVCAAIYKLAQLHFHINIKWCSTHVNKADAPTRVYDKLLRLPPLLDPDWLGGHLDSHAHLFSHDDDVATFCVFSEAFKRCWPANTRWQEPQV